jgi:hypothetical protein
MNKVFAVLMVFLFSGAVFATDLINKDSKSYKLEIKKDSSTRTEMSVSSSSSYSGVLKKGYVVKNLSNGASVTVTTDKKVLIQNGNFVQE